MIDILSINFVRINAQKIIIQLNSKILVINVQFNAKHALDLKYAQLVLKHILKI